MASYKVIHGFDAVENIEAKEFTVFGPGSVQFFDYKEPIAYFTDVKSVIKQGEKE